jgi:hypothetical protein
MRFIIVGEDDDRMFINPESICLFKTKNAKKGPRSAEPLEIEIEFMGGSKARLVGATAAHFVTAISKTE